MLDSTTLLFFNKKSYGIFTHECANRPTSRHCMTTQVQRHDRRRFYDLGAKFWIYLFTGTSDARAPSKRACNAYARSRHSHVIGIHFPCSKGMPVTSIYCTVNTRYRHTRYKHYHDTGTLFRCTNFPPPNRHRYRQWHTTIQAHKKAICACIEFWRDSLFGGGELF